MIRAMVMVLVCAGVALVPRDALAYGGTEGATMAAKKRARAVEEPAWKDPLRAAISAIRQSGSSAGLGSFLEAFVDGGLDMDLFTSHTFRTWLAISGGKLVGSGRSANERADAVGDLLRIAARLVYRAQEVARGDGPTSPEEVARIARESVRLDGKVDRLIAFAHFASKFDFDLRGMSREERSFVEAQAVANLAAYLDREMRTEFLKKGIAVAIAAGEAWRKGPGRDPRDGHIGKYAELARVAKSLEFHVADSTIEKAVKLWKASQRRRRRELEARRNSG